MAIAPKVAVLRPPKSPNQPIAPVEYDQRFQDQFSNALRLYFNEVDNFAATLLGTTGGQYLRLPVGNFHDETTQTVTLVNTAYPVYFDHIDISNGVTIETTTGSFTASISLFVMTVTAVSAGEIVFGQYISGTGVTAGTRVISQTSGTPGGVGVYQIDISQTVSSRVMTSTKDSRIVVTEAGYYNFQFSAQLGKSTANKKDVWIWAQKNKVVIPQSAGRITLQGSSADTIAAWNYVVDMAPGDYLQLVWATDDVNCKILAESATAFAPAVPSIIMTVVFESGVVT